ncbi:MAG: amidase family protein [Oscillospiraceae bacterium]|nr:amidase family protein [Oscillospiraceae bacterium]
MPCGTDKEGLPIGMQIIGRAFGEADILRAAYAFEASGGGTDPQEDAAEGRAK